MTTLLRFFLLAALFSCSIDASAQSRDRIGIALGGGAARGIAHVGVLRWLEEHHIPIDGVAGTSMGGLVGGAYAAGLSPDEIGRLLLDIDWDGMFGASDFDFSNLRRKRDLRGYPSRLEFGLKKGIAPPPSFNNGQQVDLLLSRIAAGYHDLTTFDELPTPFRAVAVDITRAQVVVLRDGSLARAMRATMSTPMVFPPVQMNGAVLVDGGAMDNLPVDIARGMGVQKVIAINVTDLGRKSVLDYSMFGLVAETMDAMIRAHMARTLASADVAISLPLAGYQPLDWRKAADLIREGHAAAEAARDRLLPLAIDQPSWDRWREARAARRRRTLPSPIFVRVEGAGGSDTSRLQRRLSMHRDHPLDLDALDASVNELGGLDRYESLTWELERDGGHYGLVFTAHPKAYGPPFVFLGVNLENTTSNEFRFGLGARFLTFDTFGTGGELRADLSVGSDPAAGGSWYRPLGSSPLFVEPKVMLGEHTLNIVHEGRVDAAYRRWRATVGGDVGVNLGRLTEVRLGVRQGWTNASIREGDPGLPEIDGADTIVHAQGTYDAQDDSSVPSRGLHAEATLTQVRGWARCAGHIRDRSIERSHHPGGSVLVVDAVVIERPSPTGVLQRWFRHVIQWTSTGDGTIRDWRTAAYERRERRRAARRSLRVRCRRLPAPGDAAAQFPWRSGLCRSVGRDRQRVRSPRGRRAGGPLQHRHRRRHADRPRICRREYRQRRQFPLFPRHWPHFQVNSR